jgi:hypothetical protein
MFDSGQSPAFACDGVNGQEFLDSYLTDNMPGPCWHGAILHLKYDENNPK